MRISDWSSDVCSSDLGDVVVAVLVDQAPYPGLLQLLLGDARDPADPRSRQHRHQLVNARRPRLARIGPAQVQQRRETGMRLGLEQSQDVTGAFGLPRSPAVPRQAIEITGWSHSRAEEHKSELKSLMRISYDVFCFTTKK